MLRRRRVLLPSLLLRRRDAPQQGRIIIILIIKIKTGGSAPTAFQPKDSHSDGATHSEELKR